MIMIVPCCGESQRFNGIKKQFLKLPSGLPLPVFSANGISNIGMKIYTFIKDEFSLHNQRELIWGGEICLLPKQTESQVDTVVQTIVNAGLKKTSIYIKDCDNYFRATAETNIVTVRHIQYAKFKLHNKSYTLIDDNKNVLSIAERSQISNYINVGGYGFASGEMFIKYSKDKKYISEVIMQAIHAGVKFKTNNCQRYLDYGEQDDYDKFLKTI